MDRSTRGSRRRAPTAGHTEPAAKLTELRGRAEHETITLVYAARDTEHNDAVVLAELVGQAPPRDRRRRLA
jgi:hypothetical protein